MSEGASRRIGGLGVPYGKRSRLLPGGFYEVVENRALRKTLGDQLNVCCRMEHHVEWLLATTDSGTLRITDEARGLSYEADLPDTTAGRDCYELVRTGRMPYSSMGFTCFEDKFRHDGSALVRHLISLRLSEVSPVSQPAYFDTTTAIPSLAGQVGEDPDDVAALAAQGELRALFTRSDLAVSAPPTVLPGVEHCNGESSAASTELELRRKLSDERAKRLGYDTPEDRLLRLYRKRLEWTNPSRLSSHVASFTHGGGVYFANY